MATRPPVFPLPEPHHFSDYGFDPHFDFFQDVLEEARRFKQRDSSSSCARSIDALHFKLQKPITRDDTISIPMKKKKKNHHHHPRRRWWKAALFFFKSRWAHPSTSSTKTVTRPGSYSGPIYTTESLSGPTTPSRSYSGPMTSASKGQMEFPYFNLRELNMDPPHPSTLPIYLVT